MVPYSTTVRHNGEGIVTTFEGMKAGYAAMFSKMAIVPINRPMAESIAKKLNGNRSRYEAAAAPIGCPWWFVAIIHNLESNANWSTHLHNGDSLAARTVRVPAGRPAVGVPPFTWETSAADAMRLKGHDKITDWSVERCLYEWERYNGWGYLGKINSPYLWAKSTLEQKGKYIRDHVWDPNATSEQFGAAVILRAMMDLKIVENDIMELRDFLAQFTKIAPTLLTVVSGPTPGLAVKALAEALTNDKNIDTGEGLLEANPQLVMAKLEASPLTSIIGVITTAEQIITTIVNQVIPPTPVAPGVAVPVDTVTTTTTSPVDEGSPLDWIFPQLKGYRTVIGMVGYAIVSAVGVLMPQLLSPEIVSAAQWLFGALAGAGAIAKVDRFISMLKPTQTTTTTVQKT